MNLKKEFYLINENAICLYNLSENKWINDLERTIFCQAMHSPFLVHYKLLSIEEKASLELPTDQETCMLPFHQIGTLYSFFDVNHNNFLSFLKRQTNYKVYFKKWIYQIVNGVYNIHVKKEIYHGFLSNQCIFIDAKLNAQIGFIGFYNNDSYDAYKYNFVKYFDDTRKAIYTKNGKDYDKNKIKLHKYLQLEEQNPNKIDDFRKYDIYSLGVLLNDIVSSMKDESSDQSFENRIEEEIIKLCLEPFDNRPNIEKIKNNIEQILSEDLKVSDSTVDIDELLHKYTFPQLCKSCYDESKLIANKLENQSKLVNYFHTADDINLINFNLHNNYKFKVNYDSDAKSFITKPILVNKEGLELSIQDFDEQLTNKMRGYLNCSFFFHNIYFCSLRDLLKIYKPSFIEIHYWLIYLTNYIQSYQFGDFIEDEDENENGNEIESKDAHLPRNFSSETILVSFFNFKDCNNFKELKKTPLNFQLSIFPFETKETTLSRIYQSHEKVFNNLKDIYSIGVLILELLHVALFGSTCFNEDDNENENDSVAKIMEKVIQNLPENQKFYTDILDICIGKKVENIFQIQMLLLLQGKSPTDENDYQDDPDIYTLEKDPSGSLNSYVNKHMNMNLNRFIGLFKCFADFQNDKLKEVFMKTLNELNQNFFSGDISMREELYFLNFQQFLDEQKKQKK